MNLKLFFENLLQFFFKFELQQLFLQNMGAVNNIRGKKSKCLPIIPPWQLNISPSKPQQPDPIRWPAVATCTSRLMSGFTLMIG